MGDGVKRDAVRIYLGLGSNLGDRMAHLSDGLSRLGRRVTLTKVSSIYETEPWGYTDQPPFLNCVCEAVTGLAPHPLLSLLKETEGLVGREPTFPGGPRVFDADLLFYGGLIMDEPGLCVPHPRIPERAFVLLPMWEIAPGLVHPSIGKTIDALLPLAEGREGVIRWAPPPPSLITPAA